MLERFRSQKGKIGRATESAMENIRGRSHQKWHP
jgi:hypothetical protein